MESLRMHVLLAVACASDRRRFVEYLRDSDSLHLTVETVGSLARCLEVLAEETFDVVVYDTEQPDVPSELGAVERLLECEPDLPVVILASDAGVDPLRARFAERRTLEVIAKSEIVRGVLSASFIRVAAAAGRLPQSDSLTAAISDDPEAILARGLAHDFNNLLGVIAANVEMARTSEGDWLDEALESIGEARSLARQLLAVREQRGAMMEELDPAALLRGTLRLLRAALGPEVATTLRLEEGAPAIMGDRLQLSRVLTNLLLNARDAVLERPATRDSRDDARSISLSLRSVRSKGGPWVEIEIEDNGPGISREKVVRIFEPFFTTKGERGGSGLGLATCRRIVAEHGGELTVNSVEGEGTRFRILLPAVVPPRPRKTSCLTSVPAAPSEEAPTVLLVDDEHRVVRVLALALEREGYRVLTATTGEDALWLAESGPVDAVLLDVCMPGIDGWGALAALRGSGVGAPVVLMSGVPLEDEPRAAEADAILAKPFSIAEMLATVSAVTQPSREQFLSLAS